MEVAGPIAFAATSSPPSGVEVLVNFGIVAGREATPAELDELAQALLPDVAAVTIVSEQRHEVNEASEAAVHQVRVAIEPERVGDRQPAELEDRVIRVAEDWVRSCAAERHAEVTEL